LSWWFIDVGYSILLVDVAAREKDPLRRIAFVAAFAMSNYSSTIGRIAKPFNPMLVCAVIFSKPFDTDQRMAERNLRIRQVGPTV